MYIEWDEKMDRDNAVFTRNKWVYRMRLGVKSKLVGRGLILQPFACICSTLIIIHPVVGS